MISIEELNREVDLIERMMKNMLEATSRGGCVVRTEIGSTSEGIYVSASTDTAGDYEIKMTKWLVVKS